MTEKTNSLDAAKLDAAQLETARLDAAKEARLLALLRRRYAGNPELVASLAGWEIGLRVGDSPTSLKLLTLCGALLIVRPERYGVTPGEVADALESDLLENDLLETDLCRLQLQPVFHRAARAMRLLGRTLTAG